MFSLMMPIMMELLLLAPAMIVLCILEFVGSSIACLYIKGERLILAGTISGVILGLIWSLFFILPNILKLCSTDPCPMSELIFFGALIGFGCVALMVGTFISLVLGTLLATAVKKVTRRKLPNR